MSYNNIDREEIVTPGIHTLDTVIDKLIMNTVDLKDDIITFDTKLAEVNIKKVLDLKYDRNEIIIRIGIDSFALRQYATLDDEILKAEAELARLKSLK